MKPIGILGGTFDPIHMGHLILAEQAWEQLDLERVVFIPAADPPHKAGNVVTAAEHRYNMVELAVRGNEHFELSRLEMDRPGRSYTIDTLKQIRAQSGDKIGLCLLVGADEAGDFMSWRDPLGIQELATVVMANRPGLPVDSVRRSLPKEVADRIVGLQMPGVDISSTQIRERIESARSVRYLVPDVVLDYIRINGLYGRE
jgi:nicotinate-nucleotide adenylyltransferase